MDCDVCAQGVALDVGGVTLQEHVDSRMGEQGVQPDPLTIYDDGRVWQAMTRA